MGTFEDVGVPVIAVACALIVFVALRACAKWEEENILRSKHKPKTQYAVVVQPSGSVTMGKKLGLAGFETIKAVSEKGGDRQLIRVVVVPADAEGGGHHGYHEASHDDVGELGRVDCGISNESVKHHHTLHGDDGDIHVGVDAIVDVDHDDNNGISDCNSDGIRNGNRNVNDDGDGDGTMQIV